MEVDLALLADAATVDGSGKLNILGIFERISASEFPARHGRMCLVLRFSAAVSDVGEHEVAISLVGPGGDQILRLDGQMQLGPGAGRSVSEGIHVPQVVNMDGVVFPQSGSYTFDVEVDGTHRAAVPLRVLDMGGRSVRA